MRVYLSEYIHPEAEQLLRMRAEIVDNFAEPEKIDAIIVRVLKVDKELMKKTKNLKVIGKHGVGCDTIDLLAAKENGIIVLNTPHANVNSVAELIVGLMLNISRNIVIADAGCHKGEYKQVAPKILTGIELSGKTLGLIGLGNIAKRTAEILRAGFGMKLVGYDPYISAETAKRLGIIKYEDIKDVIAHADVVNVSVPLTELTKNLLAGGVFKAFKPSAILINAARGGIVNEADLYTALKNKTIRAAACDAFVQEPPTVDNKLLTLANFCATPHIGALTEEALYRMGMEVVEEILSVINGNEPKHRVV